MLLHFSFAKPPLASEAPFSDDFLLFPRRNGFCLFKRRLELLRRLNQLPRAARDNVVRGRHDDDLLALLSVRAAYQRVIQYFDSRRSFLPDGGGTVDDENPIGVFLFDVFEGNRLPVPLVA